MRTFESDRLLQRGTGVGKSLQPYSRLSRGDGIGSVLGSLFRRVIPLFKNVFKIGKKVAKTSAGKSVLKKAKKSAMKAGLNVLGDTLQGENVLKSAKKHSKAAIKNIGQETKKQAIGSLMSKLGVKSSVPNNKRKSLNNIESNKKRKRVVATPSAIVKRNKSKKKDIFDK